jgi:folate-binding protein YgfZ
MFDRTPSETGEAAAEYRAVRQAVGVLDRTDLGLVEVTGRDRAAFLHAMLSNDIKAVPAGGGCAAALLDVHGKVQELLLVWVLDDRVHVVTGAGRGGKTVEALDHYLFSEKAYLRDASGERGFVVVAGPGAPPLAARLSGATVPDEPWGQATGRIADVGVRVVRGAGETGEPEVWIDMPAEGTERVRAALAGEGAGPVGFAAWESLRLETGTAVLGRDVDDSVLLPEIPSQSLLSYTKGCYVGQEVVVRIRDRGHVNRHLRGLLLEGEVAPPAGATVSAGGQDAGRVTSAAWSYGLGRPIALAFVRRQHAEPGTPVTISTGDRAITGTVTTLPFAR